MYRTREAKVTGLLPVSFRFVCNCGKTHMRENTHACVAEARNPWSQFCCGGVSASAVIARAHVCRV